MAEDKKKTITIGDKDYNVDDLTSTEVVLVNHLQDLDQKMNKMRFNLDQLQLGRDKAFELLVQSLESDEAEAE